MRSGLQGEDAVAQALSGFPDDFHVIHDITTQFGNIDHVVVGPTGVFVIDAKNWRGHVAADGKGELTWNGRPTTKPEIRRFVARMMAVREKVKALAPQLDPYYKALFVFTAAHVGANWGKTGSVNCLTEGQLFDHIVESKYGQRLKREEVDQIAQAFLALAHADRDFTERALGPAPQPARPTVSPTRKAVCPT